MGREMKKEKEEEEKPKLIESLSMLELIERLCSQSHRAGFVYKATNIKDPKSRAIYGAVRKEADLTKRELHKRLGLLAPESPEIANRAAFIYLATVRSRSKCGWCKARPLKGRGLDFWTTEFKNPLPLMRMMAWGGADVKTLKERIDSCCVLCASCAKHRGAELLSNGLVNLKAYDVEVL